MRKIFLIIFCYIGLSLAAFSQQHSGHQHEGTEHSEAQHHAEETHGGCGAHEGHHEFNPGATAFHHISDQNIYSIGPWHFPLPVIVQVEGEGWHVFSSGVFEADYHGNGVNAYNRFVLFEGQIRRVIDGDFPMGKVELGAHKLFIGQHEDPEVGGPVETVMVCYNDRAWACESKSTVDGGVLKGGMTSFKDFSITKNVASMIILALLLGWLFISVARAYKKRDGMAPSGLQSFMEPLFLFIQEEVAKPILGAKWEKYQPFLMALFFFILGLNLFGQIPFLGGPNVTGNLSVTLILALFAFLVTNLSGNAHYWQHIFWMPGIPAWVKVIVTPVELAGIIIKPLTLMLRLFGNITAGHMVIAIFVGLIFVFGESGANPGAAYGTSIGSALLTLFMMAIELLVAFIQAFVFTILTASYIGSATEEHHHEELPH